MSVAGVIEIKIGATSKFTIMAEAPSPNYDGSETVTCDMKPAVGHYEVPAPSVQAIASASVVFVEAAGNVPPHYLATFSAAQTLGLTSGKYVTDIRVVDASGEIDITETIGVYVKGTVTR